VKKLLIVLMLAIAAPVAAQTLPADVCATLRQVRGSAPIESNAQLGAMLNRIAWAHRAQGIGLNRKSGGNNCDSPAGKIACDILQRQSDGAAWDVFGSAGPGEPTTPSCGSAIDPITDPSRPFVAAVNPGDEAPGADPAPNAPTTPTPGPAPDLGPILARLDTLEASLRAEMRAQTDREIAKLDELKVALIKATNDLKTALVQLLPILFGNAGGLGQLLGGVIKK
jgi:hypothetical protein